MSLLYVQITSSNTMKDCQYYLLWLLPWLLLCVSSGLINDEPHPDPNDEQYEGMIYIGRHYHNGTRVGFDQDNGIKYIFGTSFDESHKQIQEHDLHHDAFNKHHYQHHTSDLADRNHPTKTREQVLKEQRHKPLSERGPKPFGHVGMFMQ